MGSPDFERLLTSAEKLNDHNYREQVYRVYPYEPTCACPLPITSGKRKTTRKKQQRQLGSPVCRSGCTKPCCSSVRQAKDSANDPGTKCSAGGSGGGSGGGGGGANGQQFTTHCAPTGTKNDELGGAESRKARMRGGGSGERATPTAGNFFNGEDDFTWYNTRFTIPTRLEGGGGTETYPTASCCGKGFSQKNEDFLQWDTINPGFLAANKCKLKNVEDHESKPVCSCPEKDYLESVLRKKGQGMCVKKPCLGTDCLIKAFKDAQDFVDSIGKVPGLAGLGIIESPYFGTTQDSREVRKVESKQMSIHKQSEPVNNLCNTQNIENIKTFSFSAAPHNFTSSGNKRPVVQEAITSYPDPAVHATLKSKKKDEKVEKPKENENNSQPNPLNPDAPCGEPKCKSKPKKVTEASAEASDQANVQNEKSSMPQNSNKKHAAKTKSHLGGGGDKAGNSKSKGNQFIYSFGNNYPASVYGHKNCNLLRSRVPAHMGWMWNQTDTIANRKPRPGWRPGAISVTLRDILREAKQGFLKATKRPRSAPSKTKKGKAQKTMSFATLKKGVAVPEEEIEEEPEYPPTLHIHRKDGVYYVTMYPIRQDTAEVPRLDEPINPLQFKIVKSKTSIASSSTASDMEIEFSPPAAVNRLKKKPNVIHIETQVKEQEILEALKVFDTKGKNSKGKKDKGKKK